MRAACGMAIVAVRVCARLLRVARVAAGSPAQPASPSASQFKGPVCRFWLRLSVLFPWQDLEFASVHFAPATVEGQQLSVFGCCCVT